MALFQRKDQFNITKQVFTVGLNKTFLLVGLGNPPKEYDGTRHNIGFGCLDNFQETRAKEDFSNWQKKASLKCLFSSGNLGDTRVILAKPTTFMNLSGESVRLIMDYYKITIDNLVVVHDEIDLNFGLIRTSIGGSSAGHNGIQSIIDAVGDNFARLRIGIGPKPEKVDSSDFVLGKFSNSETKQLNTLKQEVNANLIEIIYSPNIQPDTRSFLI